MLVYTYIACLVWKSYGTQNTQNLQNSFKILTFRWPCILV